MELFLQFFTNGIMVGGLYGLLAMGIVLIYKATRVFNFAVGEIVLIGGFFCWSALAWFKFPVWLSLLVALAGATIVGFLIERFSLRPLIGQPILAAIMATLGLSLMLRGLMLFTWGGSTIPFPTDIIPGSPVIIGSIGISHELLWAFFIAIIVFIALGVFFRKHKMGMFMRATAEDHQIAQSIGIDVKSVFGFTWGIAAFVGTLGGIFIGARLGLGVATTPIIALKAFPAVLFGGLESIPGALIGGLVVGVLENLMGGYINPHFSDITPYIILLLVLIFRPEGLFGLRRVERI